MPLGTHDHPIYKPLRNRLIITAVAVGWAAFEILYAHDSFWSVISGGAALYCIWAFLISFKPGESPPKP